MKKTEVEEQNKALVKSYVEAWNKGDFQAFKEVLSPDYELHWLPSTTMSREELAGFAKKFRTAFPDLKMNIQETIAEDDIVVLRSILTGTHEGEHFGIPPTGNKIEFTSIITCRIEDGKIVEEKELTDTLTFMQQLGMELKPKEAK